MILIKLSNTSATCYENTSEISYCERAAIEQIKINHAV